jgi:DNA-binding response OmpR family regulator
MIIDDDVEFLEETSDMLENGGYATRTVATSDDAIVAIAEEIPDIVLLDIKLEGGDGMGIARKLETEESTSNIPIIIVSGAIDEDTIKGFKDRTGKCEFLIKPVNPLNLIAAIETYFKDP